mgnify:CR=1 FL=1
MDEFIKNIYPIVLEIASRFDSNKDLAHDIILKLYETPKIKERHLNEVKAWIYIITKNHYLDIKKRRKPLELEHDPKEKESKRNLCIETDVFLKANLTELEEKWLLAYIYEGSYKKLAKAIDLKSRQTVSTIIREIIEKCKQQL